MLLWLDEACAKLSKYQSRIRFYLKLLQGLAASYSRIEKFYKGKTMAEMDLPDIDLDGRVVIMTGADRGLGRAMSLGLAKRARAGCWRRRSWTVSTRWRRRSPPSPGQVGRSPSRPTSPICEGPKGHKGSSRLLALNAGHSNLYRYGLLVSITRPSERISLIPPSGVNDWATTRGPLPLSASQMRLCNSSNLIAAYSRPVRTSNGS